MGYYDYISVSALKDKILVSITGLGVGEDRVVFETTDGEKYVMYHEQDCCESVNIEDVEGDVNDLIGLPLLVAEEIDSEDRPPLYDGEESYTWTFYRFATAKGWVVIRWYGSSNGYYGEGVNFSKL